MSVWILKNDPKTKKKIEDKKIQAFEYVTGDSPSAWLELRGYELANVF